ncbi:YdcF family protein [bacterium]|nr:MAG: YdcF family protein [bacterium]
MRRRRLLLSLCACVVIPFVALLSFGVWLERWGRVDRAKKSEAIIVFGAKVRSDGSPSVLLRTRTRHAFELWKRGMAPKIVCTGGVGTNPPAESVVASKLLVQWGVPESDILRDEKSTSTRENALFAAQLLPSGARVIAVSDPFHVWRCRRDCARAGLRASTSPELPGWDSLPLWSRVFYCAREAALVVRDTLLGS